MKKIVITIALLFVFQTVVAGSINDYLAMSNLKHSNLSNIYWEKHVIDEDFNYAFGVQAVDVDLDGDCDILGAAQEGDYIAWWCNEGGDPISWTKYMIDDNFDGATSVFAVDIDGDLDIDVVGSAWQANEIAVWINNNEDPIGWMKNTIKSGFNFAHEAYCYDLDQDGDIDILGASSDDHQIAWWRNEGGDPINWTEQIIGSNFFGAKSARVADIDKDGLLDVVGTAFYGDDISWWRNSGGNPIVWEENIVTNDFDGAHRAEVCDMDFDGDMDIVGAAYFEMEISWWKNEGGNPVSWTKQIVTSDFDGACIGLPVDIDDDGDIDIVGTAQRDYDVAVFRNDGGEPIDWKMIIIDGFYQGAWPGCIADIDSDGDIDIIAGSSWADKLAWWESDLNQQPTTPEKPSGPTSGKPGIEYTFTTVSFDPYAKQLYYMWSWGAGNYSDWLGPYNSAEYCTASNIWIENGIFLIKVKAKNVDGAESGWSEPITISIPRNKQISNRLYLNWLQNHPNLFPLLQKLIQHLGL